MMVQPQIRDREATLRSLLEDRILLLDGAMGTMVQALDLDEAAVRGDRFADHPIDLKNFVDVLCLTQPEAVTEIHRKYLLAGADIVTTNTFGASPVGMEEFQLPPEVGPRNQLSGGAVCAARRATRWRHSFPGGHGSSPDRLARRPNRRQSPPTSKTPATAVQRSIKWPRPTTSRWPRWSRRVSTSCCRKR